MKKVPGYADVLAIAYPGPPRWSPSGRFLSYPVTAGGVTRLRVHEVPSGRELELGGPAGGIGEHRWSPVGDELVWTERGDLWWGRPGDGPQVRQLTAAVGRDHRPVWSPSGRALAFARDEGLWTLELDTGLGRQFRVPGRIYRHGGAPVLAWSPDGGLLAYTYLNSDGRRRVAVDDAQGQARWRSPGDGDAGYVETAPVWVAGGLVIGRQDLYSTVYELLWVDVRDGSAEPIYRTRDPRGIPLLYPVVAAPDGRRLALVLEDDGWHHLYLWEPGSGLRQLTAGACEDTGHATDAPAWSPDGRALVFASNRDQAEQRQLWLVTTDGGDLRRLTDVPGSAAWPAWSPDGERVAYLQATRSHAAELYTVPVGGGSACRLTHGTPAVWAEAGLTPGRLEWEGPGGRRVRGILLLPPCLPAGRPAPAMVFVHGGPIRQMRDGWHPADTYAFFYGVQQVLAHRGVVGLLVNYRGGIGYGREHNRGLYRGMGHNELGDVIAGARALGALPYVDPGRIGIWGISYGGYLVLHAMAQFPGVFAMGVNIAGNYARLDAIGWKDRTYPGYADYKLTCLGNEAERRRASPQTHRQGITGPMLHLHGTEDEAVAFEQLHRIIADSVALGLEFDAQAYPGESHFFRRPETWRDALRRIDGYIHRYLQVPPARPGEEEGEV